MINLSYFICPSCRYATIIRKSMINHLGTSKHKNKLAQYINIGMTEEEKFSIIKENIERNQLAGSKDNLKSLGI